MNANATSSRRTNARALRRRRRPRPRLQEGRRRDRRATTVRMSDVPSASPLISHRRFEVAPYALYRLQDRRPVAAGSFAADGASRLTRSLAVARTRAGDDRIATRFARCARVLVSRSLSSRPLSDRSSQMRFVRRPIRGWRAATNRSVSRPAAERRAQSRG